jgi:acyl-coenzyme A thioesterase PaaI-like protein
MEKPPMSQALAAFNAFGPESFTSMVCQQAPYFSTIQPELVDLKPNYAEARVPFRKEITNHLGTVHAIAMCNVAELVAGLMTDVSIPSGGRWIPQAMAVRYLAKAKTSLRAIANGQDIDWDTAGEKIVLVEVFDEDDQKVFTAEITMNLKLS